MKHRVSPFSKCLYLPSPLLTKGRCLHQTRTGQDDNILVHSETYRTPVFCRRRFVFLACTLREFISAQSPKDNRVSCLFILDLQLIQQAAALRTHSGHHPQYDTTSPSAWLQNTSSFVITSSDPIFEKVMMGWPYQRQPLLRLVLLVVPSERERGTSVFDLESCPAPQRCGLARVLSSGTGVRDRRAAFSYLSSSRPRIGDPGYISDSEISKPFVFVAALAFFPSHGACSCYLPFVRGG